MSNRNLPGWARSGLWLLLFLVPTGGSCPGLGPVSQAQEPPAASAWRGARDDVWATVGATSITAGQVSDQLDRAIGQRDLAALDQQRLAAVALQKLIDRAVIYDYLQSHQRGAGESQVQLQVDALEAELEAIGQTLAGYCAERGWTEQQLRFELAWQLAWTRYLNELLTEDNLQRHFLRFRRRLDGTRIRVAHLWLSAGDRPLEPLITRALALNEQWKSGERSWQDLVAQESQGTTERAGELGWISAGGPMPPEFTAAALQLEPGQVSDPVVTEQGVHLIRCLEIEPGNPDWRVFEDRVRADAASFLYRTLAERHRESVEQLLTAPQEVTRHLEQAAKSPGYLPQ